MLTSQVSQQTPAGSAKLTLEGLEHWRERLTTELARLVTDIEQSEAMVQRWSGGCTQSALVTQTALIELKELHTNKQRDLELVLKAVNDIRRDLDGAAIVAKSAIIHNSMVLIPRRTGHPSTGSLIQSAKSPPSSLYAGARPVSSTLEMSHKISRHSAILVNSPDHVSKKLVFT